MLPVVCREGGHRTTNVPLLYIYMWTPIIPSTYTCGPPSYPLYTHNVPIIPSLHMSPSYPLYTCPHHTLSTHVPIIPSLHMSPSYPLYTCPHHTLSTHTCKRIIHTHMHTYIHTYTRHTYTYTHMHTCTYTRMLTHLYTHIPYLFRTSCCISWLSHILKFSTSPWPWDRDCNIACR